MGLRNDEVGHQKTLFQPCKASLIVFTVVTFYIQSFLFQPKSVNKHQQTARET